MPDEVEAFDARNAGLSLASGFWFGNLGNSSQDAINAYLGNYNIADYQRKIQELLHSLHGGDQDEINARRDCLQKMLEEGGLAPWEQGFITHAFGDSFAHTYYEQHLSDPTGYGIPGIMLGISEQAYSYPFGHTVDSLTGANPDSIANGQSKYSDYVNRLYSVLSKGRSNAKPSMIKNLLNDVQKIPADSDQENAFMFQWALENASFFDNDQNALYRPGFGDTKGMNLLPDSAGFVLPTPAQLDALLNKISAHCCPAKK